MPEQVVHDRTIKIHLADGFRCEGFGFQVEHNETAEFQVIEKQIEIEIVAANFEMILAADEGETDTEFEEELPDVGQ